jgi:hypothetical protein
LRFDVDVLDFYDEILAFFGLEAILATFSKILGNFFTNLLGHSDSSMSLNVHAKFELSRVCREQQA